MFHWLFGRHPRGLPTLFFSEMWERFSFYGMRALLVLYLVKALAYSEQASYGIYAAYGALVYAFPVLGGAMANAVLGYRRAIVFGGTLMCFGQLALALDRGAVTLYTGLALLCVGNGFFKPNISSTVGTLYEEKDPRRTSGFTIFYMGVNLGAFLSPLTCGPLGEEVAWGLGFGLAGIGMIVGVATFLYGTVRLAGRGEAPDEGRLHQYQWLVYGGALALVPLAALLLYAYDVTNVALLVAMVGIFGYLVWVAIREQDRVAREKLYALLVLMVFHACFWCLFEQAGSSLTLFADGCVERHGISTSMLQAVNAFFIIAFGSFFATLWLRLSAKGRNPSIPTKFALGLIQAGLGFAILNAGNALSDTGVKTGLAFLVLAYMLHTTGELCLSPVGLSAVTQLAPKRITGFVMGIWFLTLSLGHVMAGQVAKLTAGDFQPNAAFVALTEARYQLPPEGGLDQWKRVETELGAETLEAVLPRIVARGFPVSGILRHGVQKGWFDEEARRGIAELSLEGASEGSIRLKLGEFLAGDASRDTLYHELATRKYLLERGASLEGVRKAEISGALNLGEFLAAGRKRATQIETADALKIAVRKGLLNAAIAERVESIIQNGGGPDRAEAALNGVIVGPLKQRYDPVYFGLFLFAVGAGFLLLLISPFLRRMMHGVE